MRLNAIDRLAREICWSEFIGPRTKKQIGRTKAQYWAAMPDDRRDSYRKDAKQFARLLRELPLDELNRAHAIKFPTP